MATTVFEPNDLAGSFTQEGQRPLQLWAGEADKITEVFVKEDAAATFKKYEVVALTAEGKVKAFDGTGSPAGFVAQPISAEDASVAVYVGGYPNHEALVWPGSLDTFEKRRAAFIGNGAMFIGKLNGPVPA